MTIAYIYFASLILIISMPIISKFIFDIIYKIFGNLALYVGVLSGLYWMVSAKLAIDGAGNADAISLSGQYNYWAALGAATSATLLFALENGKRLARWKAKRERRKQKDLNAKFDAILNAHARNTETDSTA